MEDSFYFLVAHSSRGLGHLPLKEEITGSNPVCATLYQQISTLIFRPSCVTPRMKSLPLLEMLML